MNGFVVFSASIFLYLCVFLYGCFSINIGAYRPDETVMCELLNTDKYSASGNFHPNQTFQHYSIEVNIYHFPNNRFVIYLTAGAGLAESVKHLTTGREIEGSIPGTGLILRVLNN